MNVSSILIILKVYGRPAALLALIAGYMTACGFTPTYTPEPKYTPTPTITSEQVHVDSAVVKVLSPVQVQLTVKGNLPNACWTIDQMTQTRDGNTFTVVITAVYHHEIEICTQELVPFEKTMQLNVAGLGRGTYTVKVNDLTMTFQLP